ncbi:MAG: ABC transporter ATP-binding protein [Acidobacteriota bacterium]
MTVPLIQVQDFSHRYGTTIAVDRLSFEVAPGEVVALLGHNGAGKTTTLTGLAGLRSSQQGTLRVLGLDPWEQGDEVRRRTGYVSEDLSFHDWMTVGETLWYLEQFHPTWDRQLQHELVTRLELPLDRKIEGLSRGMRSKLALACATAFRPEVLLLDDPTSGIDPIVRREFLAEVIRLAAEGGRAVLFSSHVLDDVARLADRVLFVVGGRKILERSVSDLHENVRRVVLKADGEVGEPPTETVAWRPDGGTVEAIVDGWTSVEAAWQEGPAVIESVESLSLEDVFVEIVSASKTNAARWRDA